MNRIALITGGQGELAAALRRELVSNGYEVLAPGRREMDVTSAVSVERYFHEVSRIDFCINNAGIREDEILSRMSSESWQRVLDTNLKGAFLVSRCAAARMLQRGGGHILNVGSYSALSGPAGQANYAAAKAGLIGLTQSLAREWGGGNIRVNCVLPGWMETKFTAGVNDATLAKALSEHVLGRFNTPKEAARAIVFFDSLKHLSGQVLNLDSRISAW